MNFARLTKIDCIIPTQPPIDPRCKDAAFSLSHPSICSVDGALIIKPSAAILCHLESIQFRVFEFKDGIETELTTGIRFESSDDTLLMVGVNNGNGTGLGEGSVIVTATHTDGRTVSANILVKAAENCCDDIRVISSLVVDNSRSMTLNFGAGFTTRLAYAKDIAGKYGGKIYQVDGQPKDAVKVWKINLSATDLTDFSEDVAEIVSAVNSITQSQEKTGLLDIFDTIGADLLDSEADRRVLVIVSDGEHTLDIDKQAIYDAATIFKQAGGVIVVIGVRASGVGYDLLERIATGGFFLNATDANVDDVFAQLNYLKDLLCAGQCADAGDEYRNEPALDYSSFANWEIVSGQVNLLGKHIGKYLDVEGLFVELAGPTPAIIRTIDTYPVVLGESYRVGFKLAGNQRQDLTGMGVKVYVRQNGANDSDPNLFEQTIYPDWDSALESYNFNFTASLTGNVRLYFEQLFTGTPGMGNLLDDVLFIHVTDGTTLLEDDFDDENITYIPPACGQSAALPTIGQPDAPEALAIFTGSTPLADSQIYNLGISYVTLEGETQVSPLFAYTAENEEDVFKIIYALPTDPRVIAIRIWRSLGDDPIETDLYLLAEVPANQSSYIDSERRAAFEARYESSVTAPDDNTTAVAEGALGEGYYGCYFYDCLKQIPGAQAQDFPALPDIENDDPPLVEFSATEWVCVPCPDGFENGSEVNLIPLMTSNILPSGEAFASPNTNGSADSAYKAFDGDPATFWSLPPPDLSSPPVGSIGYKFTAAKVVTAYSILPIQYNLGAPFTWTFEGSNNGTSWTVLDSRSFAGWTGSAERFSIVNTTAYLYYRLNVTATNSLATVNLNIAEMQMFGLGEQTKCAEATATSYVSIDDAKRKAKDAATSAALQQLGCVPVWIESQTVEARCPFDQFGPVVSKSATRKSYISKDDAIALATAAATSAANSELVCSFSNNGSQLVINDVTGVGEFARATPYPSVSFKSGLTGLVTLVQVSINGFTHPFPDDVHILLRSPSGTMVYLMRNAGGNIAASNLNFVFKDAAASAMPDSSALTSGDWKPTQHGIAAVFPSPLPAGTYNATLAAFIGENPNGAWSLWIVDDLIGSSGTISNWALTITSA